MREGASLAVPPAHEGGALHTMPGAMPSLSRPVLSHPLSRAMCAGTAGEMASAEDVLHAIATPRNAPVGSASHQVVRVQSCFHIFTSAT
jgi:hypothetical protein